MPLDAAFEEQLALIAGTCSCMECRAKQMRREPSPTGLPSVYVPCRWVGVIPPHPRTGLFGLSLQADDGQRIHVALTPADLKIVYDAVQSYLGPCTVQSLKNSESPKVAGLPQEGH